MEQREQIYRFIDDHRAEMLRDLGEMIAIPSVSSNLEAVGRALEHSLEIGRRMGFRAQSLLDGQVGLIEWGEGPETLGILCHVDVVPIGDAADWAVPPFTLTQKDGRLYGRGTQDDKGMVAASLYAMQAAASLGLPPKKKVQLILGTQEEVDWTDMQAYVAAYPLPHYGFTPDGGFPISNVEKGLAEFVMEFPLEPPANMNGPYVRSITGGLVSNSIPAHCTAQLVEGGAERSIQARGVSAHSCDPAKGDNAILKLCRTIAGLNPADSTIPRVCAMLLEHFADPDCGGINLRSTTDTYNGEYIHHNVVSPTKISCRDGKLMVWFNMRFTWGEREARIQEVFEVLANRYGGALARSAFLPAVYVPRDRPFINAMQTAYQNVTGLPGGFVLEYGGTYAKAMPNVVAWGPVFPGGADTTHSENEYLTEQELLKCAKMFGEAIFAIATSEESFC